MAQNIEINKVGLIEAGDDVGWYVRVQDDRDNSGGYLILTGRDESFTEGHDSWVKDWKQLEAYFEVSHWIIRWVNE